MPVPKFQSLMFPVKGLVENTAESAQPPLTTRDCLNVRAYDSLERRNRGGQRTGLSKYITSAVNGSKLIQGLGSVVLPFDPSVIVADEELFDDQFLYADGELGAVSSGVWTGYTNTGLKFTGSPNGQDELRVVDSGDYVARTTSVGTTYGLAEITAALDLGSVYVIRVNMRTSTTLHTDIVFRLGDSGLAQDYVHVRVATDELALIAVGVTIDTITTGLGYSSGVDFDLEIRVQENDIKVYVEGVEKLSATTTHNSDETGIGVAMSMGTEAARINRFQVFTGGQPTTLRTTKLVAVSGGDVYQGNVDDGLAVPSNGTSTLRGIGRVGVQAVFQNVFFAEGLATGYQYYDVSGDEMKSWSSDLTAGSLPVGAVDASKACRIIALYRGRVVLSGLEEEPQNWFMSKSGDPFDWDYSPSTTTPVQAVAGNNSNVGELGDVVTALAPYQDDVMVLGGANSIWVMRGDPAAGGAIDNITRQIGIVGPDAWTWDTGNVFYFFGENGLYRMSADSGTPELLSRGRLDKTFADIDIASNHIRLVYDVVWQGVHIFVSPAVQPGTASTHYFWDERNDAFFKDQYPASVGPTAVLRFNADTPEDSGILLGGYDSYIRVFDDAAKNDDGTAISSHVLLPPIQPGAQYASARLDDVNIVMGKGGDDVLLEAYAASTPEEANDAAIAGTSPRFSRTLGAGRNSYLRQRVAQNAVVLRLEQTATQGTTTTWAFEQGGAKISVLDRMRGRRV